MTTNAAPKCQYCGNTPHNGLCPQVKAIEYYEDGAVKRVELMTPKDYPVSISTEKPPFDFNAPMTNFKRKGFP